MAKTTFTDGVITVTSAFLNDLQNQVYNATALTPSGSITVDFTQGTVFTLTPGQTGNILASGGIAGQRATIYITTSGTSSYTLTFTTNFKTTGTLATGTVSGKVFCISFVCKDGTTWAETGRTTAM